MYYHKTMAEYIRARSDEHKDERMNDIKKVTDELFSKTPYHEINLKMIADSLSWSRTNLYKYVTTKEEIFLEVSGDKMATYYESLYAALPQKNNFSPNTIAELWAGIANANMSYFRYVNILTSIIETNVTVDRLASFKKRYYEHAYKVRDNLAESLHITKDASYKLTLNVLYYCAAIATSCYKNPLIIAALQKINIEPLKQDFYGEVKEFIQMNIDWSIKNKSI